MTRTLLLVGSGGAAGAPGTIAVHELDIARRTATLRATAELASPSFLALSPDGSVLYSVDEIPDGALCAYSLNRETAKLTPIGRTQSRGDWPCHIRLDRSARYAFVTNFGQWDAETQGAQQLALIPLDPSGAPMSASITKRHTGLLGRKRPKQDRPHAHCTLLSADNRFALVSDFGLDTIFVYPFDAAKGTLGPAVTACRLPPGSAPRTLAWRPDGATLCASLELSSELARLSFDANTGALSIEGIASSLPAGADVENFPAEVRVSPDGRFAYLGNRGHDSIAVFAVDAQTPKLIATHSTGGSWPRCLDLTPGGRHLIVANQISGDIRLFDIDTHTGTLSGGHEIARAPAPTFVAAVEL